jgi:hypothetical protein
MKALPLVIFGIAALAQWAAPLSQIWTYEQTLSEGTLIKLKCSAPDPYDPLRGRYLAVRPEQAYVDVPADFESEGSDHVFAILTTGADGLATATSLSLSPPASGDYIRVTMYSSYDKKAYFEWPFERFYINEKLAPEADEWFAENIRSTMGVIAEVRVRDGRAVLVDLTLDGKSFREILKERVK